MKLIAEITPSAKETFWNKIEEVIDLVDIIDIPESPLGEPRPNSIAVSSVISMRYGIPVIAHIRVRDVNKISLLSLCQAAKISRIYGILLTRGDKSDIDLNLSSEEAAEIIRSNTFCGYSVNIGSVLSFRYIDEKIFERLSKDFNFYLAIFPRYGDLERLNMVRSHALILNKNIYTYVIVRTRKNRDIIDNLNQFYIDIEDLDKIPEAILKHSDGLLISCPADWRGLIRSLKHVKSIIG